MIKANVMSLSFSKLAMAGGTDILDVWFCIKSVSMPTFMLPLSNKKMDEDNYLKLTYLVSEQQMLLHWILLMFPT